MSNLFPKAVPPVISFAMGSLGFLTAFDEFELGTAIDDVVRGEFFFTPRSRLCAYVVDANGVEESAGDTQVRPPGLSQIRRHRPFADCPPVITVHYIHHKCTVRPDYSK